MSEKIWSIPENVSSLNHIDTPNKGPDFLERERLRLEKEDQESKYDTGSIESIILDGSNKVTFPGFPYSFRAIGEQILVSIDIPLTGFECKVCGGKKRIETKQGRETVWETCPECKGVGGKFYMVKTAKQLPRTGVILSMGKKAKLALDEEDVQLGDRVLFSEHAGSMIPTQADLMFKYMDWYCVKLKIEGAEKLGAFDFILQAEE